LANKTVDERIWAALHDKRAISDVAMEELKWLKQKSITASIVKPIETHK
jgi:hypothetical protein